MNNKLQLKSLIWWLLFGFLILLAIGIIGFRYLIHTSWIDAFYYSSLHFVGSVGKDILVTPLQKLFVSIYGLISGFIFVGLAVFAIDKVIELYFLSS